MRSLTMKVLLVTARPALIISQVVKAASSASVTISVIMM